MSMLTSLPQYMKLSVAHLTSTRIVFVYLFSVRQWWSFIEIYVVRRLELFQLNANISLTKWFEKQPNGNLYASISCDNHDWTDAKRSLIVPSIFRQSTYRNHLIFKRQLIWKTVVNRSLTLSTYYFISKWLPFFRVQNYLDIFKR